MVEQGEGRARTAIHMWMVFMRLGVAWVDASGTVVDRRLALPWRLYLPSTPARYVLEGPETMLESIAIGDRLEFKDEAPV